ncbi:MAG: A24 family peptidase [Propionibacteriaceae bacterium]|nr:A24 family peptidase [Propionibacteriaceae bacterium]
MSGLTIAALAGLGVAGWLVGLALRRNLNRFAYRIVGPRRDDRDQPYPGPRWWVPIALALAWASLGFAYAHDGWPWLALWLPYTAAGVWLAAVDFDVRRLPDKVQIPLACYAAVIGGLYIFLGYGDWLGGVIGFTACLLLFGVTSLVNGKALGLGDVKHVVICGWCLGLLGWTLVFYGVIIACLFGIGWGATHRERVFAFGPWLVLGTTAAAVIAGLRTAAEAAVSLT